MLKLVKRPTIEDDHDDAIAEDGFRGLFADQDLVELNLLTSQIELPSVPVDKDDPKGYMEKLYKDRSAMRQTGKPNK